MDDGTRINVLMGAMAAAVFVLFCLIVLCARHCRSDEHDDDLLYGRYNIDMIDGRDLLLRENLADTVLEDGKSEWQCIVCIHMNHPDHDRCALCGASVDASLLNGSMLNANLTVLSTTRGRNNTAGNNNNNNTAFLYDTAFLNSSDIPMLRSSSGATTMGGSIADSIELTTNVRQRALRYRRLNSMQLNQKQRGASRRRHWQRVSLPNGAFVWVRTTGQPTLRKADSFLSKLRNNTFLTKNPHANVLRGTVAEQLRRKNAATMGFFTELDDDGAMAWRKTDAVTVQIDAVGGGGGADENRNTVPAADLDFEGLMSMPFREKKKWLLKKVAGITVPYMESLHRVSVRRDHVLQDSVFALGGYLTPRQLMEHLNITFIGEPALDAGGVLREWFGLVCKELFSAELGLFCTTHAENMSYWINPTPSKKLTDEEDYLKYYTFAGRLFGKAILEGLVFETNMALPLIKHFLSVPITFSDLEFLDEELYRSAVWIRDNDNVDSICVTFSVQNADGEVVDLKPNGSEIDVTDENKMEYLALMLRYRMLGSVSDQLAAMLAGLYEIVPKSMLSVFDYQELDFFLSGLPVLNVKDWQLNTRTLHYTTEADIPALEQEIQVVLWFWEAVEAFTDEERARLLQFATGSARVPVEGFKALTSASGYVHPFSLQLVPPGTPPLGMCPRAHTCFNRIDLPVYKTKEDLVTYLTLCCMIVPNVTQSFTHNRPPRKATDQVERKNMRVKHKRKVKKSSSGSDHDRKGSTCELCAHEDNTPCGALCVKGLENPLVANTVCFQRRSPHVTAFYCQCAQLYGEIHRMTLLPVSENFQEEVVNKMGNKVLAKFHQVFEDSTSGGGGEDDSNNLDAPPVCPFVMLLSILLPSLRKHLGWVFRTRPVWAFGDGTTSFSGSSSSSQSSSSSSNTLLSMIALHDVLMKVTLECDKLSHLMEVDESVELEQVLHVRPTPITAIPSGSSKSITTSTSAASQAKPRSVHRIPQIKKISLEFEDVYAEYKCQLAELTESILETTETHASRLCRPLMSKDASKSRGSATEFMELLVIQLLDPIGKRTIASSSPSRPYLFPRILERCISVAMNEFVLDNGKMNEILAAQFEKGVAFLRSWSLKLEMDYNNLLKKNKIGSLLTILPRNSDSQLANANNGGSESQQTANSNSGASPTLQLVALDGFKRLENVLNTWLRSANKEEEVLSARVRMKTNLGGLRTTIARSITTKNKQMS